VGLGTIAAGIAAAAPAWAQGAGGMAAASGTDQVQAGPLVLAAYAMAWTVVLFWVFTLWRRSAKIESELRDVQAKLTARTTKR
jgi:CcmD family protein